MDESTKTVSPAAVPVSGQPRKHIRRRFSWRVVLTGLTVFLAGGLCAWAVFTMLPPSAAPLKVEPATFVKVGEGTVSQSLELNAVARWEPFPLGVNRAVGVVTSVNVDAGQLVDAGTVLYGVQLRPVVIARGDVPSFREIALGVAGADVTQLQRMLADTGFYGGAVDGSAGVETVAAVRAWQRQLGVQVSGVVLPGDIVFVPSLPVRVVLDGGVVSPGRVLSGGEDVLRGLPAAPSFRVSLTAAQARMVSAGTGVRVFSPGGGVWEAVAGEQKVDGDNGNVSVALAGVAGGVVCGDACSEVPVTGQAALRSEIVIVPEVSGLVVPSATLVSEPAGGVVVFDAAGGKHAVRVVESAKGMSVVEGVSEGLSVRVPGRARGDG